MGKILYLCWKAFIKGGYWLYFSASLLIGLPFIKGFSMFFELSHKIILISIWFFLLQISELVNMKINEKLYNYWNVFWGLVGFSLALFLMQ